MKSLCTQIYRNAWRSERAQSQMLSQLPRRRVRDGMGFKEGNEQGEEAEKKGRAKFFYLHFF